ncbi:hypothetical protein SAICODRAFT_5383 [Saitoella complicata NRRL Y-17804]|nr:uncharacterized protein SAICODRAFT_5383 [Saitoella complicata NRRL Y-17804]ODQ55436.1 hypothetical protein SAICODRAFT_5383 [Saitoella complicata NRRL Y-17804]
MQAENDYHHPGLAGMQQMNQMKPTSYPALPQKPVKKRTKTGCMTCRKRRIKCDETKPTCRNCAKSKRACEGYGVRVSFREGYQPKEGGSPPGVSPASGQAYGHSDHGVQRQDSYDQNAAILPPLKQQDIYAQTMPVRSSPLPGLEFDRRPSLPSLADVPRTSTFVDSPPSMGIRAIPSRNAYPQSDVRSSIDYGTRPSQMFPTRSQSMNDVPTHQPSALTGSGLHSLVNAAEQQYSRSIMRAVHAPRLHGDSEDDEHEYYHKPAGGVRTPPQPRQSIDSNAPSVTSNGSGSPRMSISALLGGAPAPVVNTARIDEAEQDDLSLYEPEDQNMLASAGKAYAGLGMMDAATTQIFNHFLFVLGPIMNTFDSAPADPEALFKDPLVAEKNLWTYLIPMMAMRHDALLHSVLALSALHMSKVAGGPGHVPLLHYHLAIRKLRRVLEAGEREARDEAMLAATLLLSYYEVMSAEHVKWGRHMIGAKNLVKTILEKERVGQGSKDPVMQLAREKLVWLYLRVDMIQALLSGNGMLLDRQYWHSFVPRNTPAESVNFHDHLLLLMSRLANFCATDRERKVSQAGDDNASAQALEQWESLENDLRTWYCALPQDLLPFNEKDAPKHLTPFGLAVYFKEPAIAALHFFYSTAVIQLRRAHPSLPATREGQIRGSAARTAGHCTLVPAIVAGLLFSSGVMLPSMAATGQQLSKHYPPSSSIISALLASTFPMLVAGLQAQAADQRAFLEESMEAIFELTGSLTASRVIEGYMFAWGQKQKVTRCPTGDLEDLSERRERRIMLDQESGEQLQWVLLTNPERIGFATGVLGELDNEDYELFRGRLVKS